MTYATFASSMTRRALVTVAAITALALASVSGASADSGDIEVIEAFGVSEFPEGIRFFVQAQSSSPIEDVQVRFSVVGRRVSQYDYLDLPKPRESTAEGELFFRTNSPERYIPPGTVVEYFFEVEDASGARLETDPQQFILLDARFEWETVQSGPITVYYHGPVERRAQQMGDATHETLQNMGPILGAEIESPINITMYNNTAEMIAAVVPRSTTISRELITEGQAFGPENSLLVLGNGRRALGTVSHEVTHILVWRATEGSTAFVPTWLNEGLAEFGNLDPGVSYERFLEWAVDTDRLIPLDQLDRFPGDPNLVIVSYGHARDVVRHLIQTYGQRKMAELFAEIRDGSRLDPAFQRVYGLSVRELDREWREIAGASPLSERAAAVLPTRADAAPPLTPYSLTPTAGESSIFAPTPTPALLPSPTPEASTMPPEPPAPSPAPGPTPEEPSGAASGSCSAPGARSAVDISGIALLAGLAATWLVRRGRRLIGPN